MAKAFNEIWGYKTLTEVQKLVKALTNTRKTIKNACTEIGIEYKLFHNEREVNNIIDQCSMCNHWRPVNTLEHDAEGFPTCKVCIEVYGL